MSKFPSNSIFFVENPYFPDYWENELILLEVFSETTPFLDPHPVTLSDPLKN